jgi:opacity protein-like surface antigen
MGKVTASLAIGLLLVAVPARAQVNEKKVNVNLGGGYTFTEGEVRNHLGDGYNFNIGLTFNVTPVVGIQAEYSFNGLGQKNISIPVSIAPGGSTVPTDFFADMNMQYGDFNLVLHPKTEGKAKPYVVAGMGVYYRPVKVTTPGVGYVPGYCDPWWYVCYPGGWVPVESIVGDRSSTDFGMDFGGGVDFHVGGSAAIYVEARYHYIWGPTITNPIDGTSQKANGQFFPITFGVRF